jgi:hypothetical protein
MVFDTGSILAGITAIATILVAVFLENNHKFIENNKKNIFPMLKALITKEIQKYDKETEPNKQKVLSRVIALDSFRIALHNESSTLNRGLLYFGICVIYFLVLLFFSQFVSLGAFFTGQNPPLPTTLFGMMTEFIMFPLMFTAWKFQTLWKINSVMREHIDGENPELTEIICKHFQSKYAKSKVGT